MKVEWSLAAAMEFRAAMDFVEEFNAAAAARLGSRLEAAADSLVAFPRRGREVQPGIRQLSIVYPYLIRYRISDDIVEILSIRHGARHETD